MTRLLFWVILQAAPEVATDNPHLRRGVAQLAELDEAGALRTLEKARAWPKNTPHDLALVHLYLGLAYSGLSQGAKAVDAFRAGLLIEPELQLPADASPRIREWWVKAGGKLPEPAKPSPEPSKPTPEPVAEPQPVLTPQPAPAPEPPPAVVEPAPMPPPRSRAAAFITGGAGLAFLGVGVGGLVYSLGVANQYRLQQPGGPNAASPTVSRADAATAQTLYPISIASLVLGAVLLGMAVYLLL